MAGAHVTVLGAGALGSVYAAWAAEAGNDVTIVARQAHADAVNRNGLVVVGRDGTRRTVTMRATSDPAAVESCDYLCLASKAPDTDELLDGFLARPRRLTAAFSIQNGARPALRRRRPRLRVNGRRHAARAGGRVAHLRRCDVPRAGDRQQP
jgi:2-dehydropantoate 2-reductase